MSTLATQRGVRIAFLTLLAVCVAQAAYWTIDQALYTSRVHEQRLAEHARDVRAALELEQRGASRDEVLALYPELEFVAGVPALSAATRAALDDARTSRLVRYGSEGAFFLLVLCGSIWVLARALRQDAALRRRQQSFLASASHEFKSPLASARLSIETLALRDPPLEARAKLFDRALEDLARLDGLVVNLLDDAQLEEGGVRLVRERVDLAQAARAALAEVESRVRAHAVGVGIEAAGPVECAADPIAVRSVMRNLLDNALKAVDTRSEARVDVRVEARGDRAVFSVRDNGVGFDGRNAERLFEKFHREPNARSRTGAGLGLFLVRRFAELQGGFARASSDGPGRGALFEVGWPRAEAAP